MSRSVPFRFPILFLVVSTAVFAQVCGPLRVDPKIGCNATYSFATRRSDADALERFLVDTVLPMVAPLRSLAGPCIDMATQLSCSAMLAPCTEVSSQPMRPCVSTCEKFFSVCYAVTLISAWKKLGLSDYLRCDFVEAGEPWFSNDSARCYTTLHHTVTPEVHPAITHTPSLTAEIAPEPNYFKSAASAAAQPPPPQITSHGRSAMVKIMAIEGAIAAAAILVLFFTVAKYRAVFHLSHGTGTTLPALVSIRLCNMACIVLLLLLVCVLLVWISTATGTTLTDFQSARADWLLSVSFTTTAVTRQASIDSLITSASNLQGTVRTHMQTALQLGDGTAKELANELLTSVLGQVGSLIGAFFARYVPMHTLTKGFITVNHLDLSNVSNAKILLKHLYTTALADDNVRGVYVYSPDYFVLANLLINGMAVITETPHFPDYQASPYQVTPTGDIVEGSRCCCPDFMIVAPCNKTYNSLTLPTGGSVLLQNRAIGHGEFKWSGLWAYMDSVSIEISLGFWPSTAQYNYPVVVTLLIRLLDLAGYLKELVAGTNRLLYVVDANGILLAGSQGRLVRPDPQANAIKAVTATDSEVPLIAASAMYLKTKFGGFTTLVHDVPMTVELLSESFFLQTTRIADDFGLSLAAVLLIPVDSVLGPLRSAFATAESTINTGLEKSNNTINRANQALESFIQGQRQLLESVLLQSHASTSHERSKGERDQVGIALFVMATSVVIALCSTIFIIAPLLALRDAMALIATMQVENVVMIPSGLSETREMQASFREMVARLAQYKTFMPRSLFAPEVENDQGSSDDGDEEGNTHLPEAEATKQTAERLREQAERNGGMTSRSRSASSSSSFYIQLPAAAPVAANDRLALRARVSVVSVLTISMSGFNRLCTDLHPHDLVDLHAQYIGVVSAAILRQKGSLDRFVGDRVLASWSASLHCVRACRCALACHRSIAQLNDSLSPLHLPSVTFRTGISSSRAFLGTFGTDTIRSNGIIGECVTLANALEEMNKQLGSPALIDHAVYTNVRYTFSCRIADVLTNVPSHNLVHTSRHGKCAYSLESERGESGHDEWMYQLGSQERHDRNAYSQAWDHYLRGDFIAADASLQLFFCEAKNSNDRLANKLRARIAADISDRTSPSSYPK